MTASLELFWILFQLQSDLILQLLYKKLKSDPYGVIKTHFITFGILRLSIILAKMPRDVNKKKICLSRDLSHYLMCSCGSALIKLSIGCSFTLAQLLRRSLSTISEMGEYNFCYSYTIFVILGFLLVKGFSYCTGTAIVYCFNRVAPTVKCQIQICFGIIWPPWVPKKTFLILVNNEIIKNHLTTLVIRLSITYNF